MLPGASSVCSTEQLKASVNVVPSQASATVLIVPGGLGSAVPTFSKKSVSIDKA